MKSHIYKKFCNIANGVFIGKILTFNAYIMRENFKSITSYLKKTVKEKIKLKRIMFKYVLHELKE